MLKIYGVPLSQPFRSVVWTCAIQRLPFEVKFATPRSKKPVVGCLSPEFLAINPTGQIPVIDDDGFVVANSPAILQYLSEKNEWNNLYPDLSSQENIQTRARINWFLANHSTTLRVATLSIMRPLFWGTGTPDEAALKAVEQQFDLFENFWLANGTNKFVAGENLSIADMLAFEEIGQLETGNLYDFQKKRPGINSWIQRMKELPFYEEIHIGNHILGDISKYETIPTELMIKANKESSKILAKFKAEI